MTRPGAIGERTLALFFLGLLLFNPPLLSLFSLDVFLADVPLLYLYLFVAWGAFIALVGLSAARAKPLPRSERAPPHKAGPRGKV
ncbi:MAG: hypothetical protein MI920_26435 [Kiloniellales bacterium]|nr:hypothetical protein [Kiloniellales bacterium]